MSRLGADVTALDAVARELDGYGARVDRARAAVEAQLRRTSWMGPDADAFRARWHRIAVRDLEGLRTDLVAAAAELRRQTAQQRATSGQRPVFVPGAVLGVASMAGGRVLAARTTSVGGHPLGAGLGTFRGLAVGAPLATVGAGAALIGGVLGRGAGFVATHLGNAAGRDAGRSALWGAGLGALVGSIVGGATGAAVGAMAGALIGARIGSSSSGGRRSDGETGSGQSTGGDASPHVVARRSYTVEDGSGALLVEGGRGTTIEVLELSDGTHRVVLDADATNSFGIGLSELLHLGDLADVGLRVGTGDGFRVEFHADDAAAAQALEDALRGRADHWTNVSILGSVSLREALGVSGNVEARLLSITETHPAAEVTGGGVLAHQGVHVGALRYNETTVDVATGLVTDRTVIEGEVYSAGVRGGQVDEIRTMEIVRDPGTGEAISARYELTTSTSTDVRDDARRASDGPLAFVTGGVHRNVEHDVRVTTTSTTFDLRELDSGPIVDAARSDDRLALIALADEHQASGTIERTVHEGTSEGATRGLKMLGYGGSRGFRTEDLRLVEHELLQPGEAVRPASDLGAPAYRIPLA